MNARPDPLALLSSGSGASPASPAPLNQGQEAAANAFFQFLFSDEDEFIISGPGGTGKTHLMSHLIDTVMPNYFQTCKMMGIEPIYQDVKMTATTNKAAEVLAVATSRPTDTIHSFLNLKVSDDFSTGESKLVKSRNWTVHERIILFIDECSMIDHALLEMIREGTQDCKVVYVGDHCQLAPVKEVISPVYRRQPPIPFYALDQQMRNNGQPALMAVCEQLRRTVETGEFEPIQIVPGVVDLLDDADMEYALDHVFKELDQGVHQQSRVLAFTNGRVMQYNDHVRDLRQMPDEYQVGEVLVNNGSVRLKHRMIAVEEEVTLEAQADKTHHVEIEDGVLLEVRESTLKSAIGDVFHGVLLPVDRNHFTELVKYYRRKKLWNRYYHLKNTYPDLRQRDAATVHKSQGSTYDSVFIDLANISTCNIANQVARMLYVAFSRPRTRVFLYGQLAAKYGGLRY